MKHFLLAALLGLFALMAAPVHAASVYVSCLVGHDGGGGFSAIQVRRVRSDQSFNVTRLRAWGENGGLVADRSGATLNAVMFTAPQAFGGTTVTTTSLFGTQNVGRVLVRLDITDTRASLSENAPFLIMVVNNSSTPPARFATFCDGGGFDR
jgi:hypothetical protein